MVGTDDHLVIENWYSGSASELDRFETAAGYGLEAGQVEQLRSAMAGFNPPPGPGETLTQAMQDAVYPVIATTWQDPQGS